MKQPMTYQAALIRAQALVAYLTPRCERIEIAGSIRRKKEMVGDIEIVAIPRLDPITNLFGEVSGHHSQLNDAALFAELGRVLRSGLHYVQVEMADGVCLDLFITTPEQWGVIYTIRTGSADFSHWLVTPRQQGGACPGFAKVRDGRIWVGSTALDTPEERDVFKALELPWISPEARTAGFWGQAVTGCHDHHWSQR